VLRSELVGSDEHTDDCVENEQQLGWARHLHLD